MGLGNYCDRNNEKVISEDKETTTLTDESYVSIAFFLTSNHRFDDRLT